MTEGTKSYLFGCHHFFIHPLLVFIAWRKEYRSWPKFWELGCIFLHDIGHLGKQYLSDPDQKAEHWRLGAKIALRLFGFKGYALVAGHAKHPTIPSSKMFIPEKRSWLEAPDWWLWLNYWAEDFKSDAAKPKVWKKMVAENLQAGCPKDSHEMYLENRRDN